MKALLEKGQFGNILLNNLNGQSLGSQKETKTVYNNISMKLNLDQAYSNGGKQADSGNIIKLRYIGPGFLT